MMASKRAPSTDECLRKLRETASWMALSMTYRATSSLARHL